MRELNLCKHHLYAALAGIGLCIFALALGTANSRAALSGWLVGFIFWSSLPIGALFLLMMMQLMPGAWSNTLQPPAHAALPLQALGAVAFLPLLVGASELYPWATSGATDGFKSVYLTAWFFSLRGICFFLCLGVLSFLLSQRPTYAVPTSIIGLILLTIVDSLMAFDWLMSLDPDFHSSGFGLYVMSIQIVIALAFLVSTSTLFQKGAYAGRYHGALLLTCLLLWAYFSFMQYFITWSGNLPQGVKWYQQRGGGVWGMVEWTIAILHLLPMLLLVFPPIRLNQRWLCALAFIVLVGKALEVSWLILPALPAYLSLGLVSAVAAMSGLGLLNTAVFLAVLKMFRKGGVATSRGVAS